MVNIFFIVKGYRTNITQIYISTVIIITEFLYYVIVQVYAHGETLPFFHR